jgi:hypothetical protein
MPTSDFPASDFPDDDLKRFLAYMQNVEMSAVEVRGLVPGEPPEGYARFLSDAIQRAWGSRGHRPLPPGYDESSSG